MTINDHLNDDHQLFKWSVLRNEKWNRTYQPGLTAVFINGLEPGLEFCN